MIRLLIKIFKWTFGVLFTLLVTGFIYEQISRQKYNALIPAKEEFVTINDRQLHFHKEGSGNTTVVFESGIGGDYRHWQEIQKEVAKYATTISYDRAGILWSEPTDEISLERYANDLFQLLEKTDCPKPYVLVGHSFAGITLRKFIKDHAADISGIVFIDVSHPQQLKRSSEKLRNSVVQPPNGVLSFLNETGILRIMFTLTPFTKDVPEDHWFNTDVKNYFYKILPGLQQEMNHDKELMAEADGINDFGNIPLTIITASYPNGVERINDKELQNEYLETHKILQTDLFSLSMNSKQVFAEKSGHYVTLQQPDLIVNEIKSLLGQLK